MDIPSSILKSISRLDDFNMKYEERDTKLSQFIINYKDQFNFNGRVTLDLAGFAAEQNLSTLPVITNSEFMQFLRTKYPAKYPQPNIKLPFSQLIQRSEEFITINTRTQKKRRLVVLQDVFLYDTKAGRKVKIIPYNSYIGEKSIAMLKKYSDVTDEVEASESETGCLVFIPDVKDFKLKVDLFAILATFDFPIYDSDNYRNAMEIYKTKEPKMVVIANLESSVQAKYFLIELEEYDPYVKKLNFNQSPASYKDREIKRLGLYYYSGYKEILDIEKEADSKETLPEELKKSILNNIRDLETSFSPDSFYEKAYALKQFGRYFNIKILWNMMLNIKKKHIHG
jgi:hypothetical protein